VEAPASALQCLLDGHPVELTHTKIAEKFKAQGFMPACPTVNRATLTFICPGVASPAETIGSRDQRRLGLAFRQLRLDTGKAAEIDGAFLRREGSATSNEDGAPGICQAPEPGPDETP